MIFSFEVVISVNLYGFMVLPYLVVRIDFLSVAGYYFKRMSLSLLITKWYKH